MKIQAKGKITIPKRLREILGLGEGVEIDMVPTAEGLLIKRCAPKSRGAESHFTIDPSVIGSARGKGLIPDVYANTDDYINDIRGPVDHGS